MGHDGAYRRCTDSNPSKAPSAIVEITLSYRILCRCQVRATMNPLQIGTANAYSDCSDDSVAKAPFPIAEIRFPFK